MDADTIETLLLELHNEISRGLTYANEVYATQGAVLHTVLRQAGCSQDAGQSSRPSTRRTRRRA